MRWDTTRDSKQSILRSEKFWIACMIIGVIGMITVLAINPSGSNNSNSPPPVICHSSNGCFQGQVNATGTFQFTGRVRSNVTFVNGSNRSYVFAWWIYANYTGAVRIQFGSHDNSSRVLTQFGIVDMNSTQYFTSKCFSFPSVPCPVGPGTTFRTVTVAQPYVRFNIGHLYRIDIFCDTATISQYFTLNVA